MERLPYIDEHYISIGATREQVWRALVPRVGSTFRAAGGPIARVLGLAPARAGGEWRREVRRDDTLPGFVVSEANPPRRLELQGRHRFSRYALIFELDQAGPERCILRAQTWAEFPGLTGRVYRALVIGSGGHRVVVKRLLRDIASRA
jgi:hypothetical protein